MPLLDGQMLMLKIYKNDGCQNRILREVIVVKIYLIPIQRVLLEYVLKLGNVIFFPGNVNDYTIDESSLDVTEKKLIKDVISKNEKIFSIMQDVAFILIHSEYFSNQIKDNPNILENIFYEASKSLDYVRILECPFSRPEYFIGVPGLLDKSRILMAVNNNNVIETYISGADYYYSMQKGMGLDLGSRETTDINLYKVLFSERHDIVYNTYRKTISEACEALKIVDEGRCFIYLFSKVDRMGLCDSFQFQENKKRVISCIAKTQHEFESLSNDLYYYSKKIRTEVVHKGKRIEELMGLDDAQKINQQLFNIIIKFCCAIINTGIDQIDELKKYIANSVSKYTYNMPHEKRICELPAINYPKTTYIADIEGIAIEYPQKRGNILILPRLDKYSVDRLQ